MSGVRGICYFCSLPPERAAEADAFLAGGGTARDMSRRFGGSKSGAHRHKAHVRGRLKRAAEDRKAGSDPELLDKLLELNRITKGILEKAYNSGDLPTALSAVARAEKQLELEGRLLGALKDGATTNVVSVTLDPETALRMAQLFVQRRQVGQVGANPGIDTVALPRPTEGETRP